ncbi:class I SAM-dependent methyltransferase [Candidatus Pelagibacter sp.]|nr:class I SAM-dependent methyltransferase [Candidatus Pelagibacter sp.]
MKQINGDKPGNVLNRLLYFYQCISNHKKGSDKSCEISNPTLSIINIDTFDKSPSRLLCDGFWNSIDFENLKLQLNSKLNIFDIGCGSGKYGKFLEKLSNQFFGNYTGLDIYKSDKYPEKFNHICDRAENVYHYINKKINFVISQSALEHIEKDIVVIEEITKKLNKNNTPFIQIHMVPASKSLWLHLLHGYRQYSKKNLSKISNQLKKKFNVNTFIIPLGGNNSFWTHLRFITLPTLFRRYVLNDKLFKWSKQKNIEQEIVKSVKKELDCKQENPIFWAFIINSNKINIKNNLVKNFKS